MILICFVRFTMEATLCLRCLFYIFDIYIGGGSYLTQQERDEIRAEVDAEFEAEDRGLKNKRRKKMQKKSQTEDDDFSSLFGGGITGKLPRFANKITLKVFSSKLLWHYYLWGECISR